MDQIYDFYQVHLRSANHTDREYGTNFTFFAIDEECATSSPNQCILCCDAPDHGEGDDGIKLRQLRMPIEKMMPFLLCFEHLSMTPSETQNPSGTA